MTQNASDSRGTTATAQALAVSAPVVGLSIRLTTWLYTTHEELARELHRAQSTAAAAKDESPSIVVDTLPEKTRRYLWEGMRQHYPDLAQLVRDPVIAEMRERFSASLHLHVPDILKLIIGTARVSRASAAAERRSPAPRTSAPAPRTDPTGGGSLTDSQIRS
jgi:hypothetical protein